MERVGAFLKRVCLRIKGIVIGSKMMNRFGWAVVTIISIAMLIFTGLSLTLPWWAIDYTHNCGGYYKVLMLRYGMCDTASSQHPEQNSKKCTAWYDKEGWDQIEQDSGVDTHRAVTYTYPLILVFTYTAMAVLLLQLLICIFQWRNMLKNMWMQRCVLLLTAIFLTLQAWINSIGPDTPLTDENTWKYTNECTESNSYPGFGDYFPVAAAYMGWVVFFVANFPDKCCCVHLIRSDQELSNDEPSVLNKLGADLAAGEALTPSGNSVSSIHYADASSPEVRFSSAGQRSSSTELMNKV